jgi:predicted secreted protein
MKIPSIIAIYFVVWWITLFVVLPFGIKNSNEAGEKIGRGNDIGAPVVHGLLKKALINSVLAALVTAGLITAVNAGLLGG